VKRSREESRSCIAFDIDGVFKYGREWSKDGSKALEKVVAAGMPFVFVTNGGGGLTETAYASSMTTKIAGASKSENPVRIGPERMVLSYTPWKTMLAPTLKDSRVLLIGDPREKVLEVAHSYGFTLATHYQDYAIKHDTVNPFRAAKAGGTSHTAVSLAAAPSHLRPTHAPARVMPCHAAPRRATQPRGGASSAAADRMT
jgi:ribonucleotide monophosphatase NagD (HAD superfamily)